MKRAAIYARVSSTGDRQDTARQVADLTRYAESEGIDIVKIYEEKASGAKADREQLAACMDFLKAGDADILLVSELSRLGRSLRQVLEVVESLTSAGVDIVFLDHHLHTLQFDGTPDPVTKLLISLLGTFAEMEREQISYRLNSGRRRAMENGVKMGRKPGYRLSEQDLLARYPEPEAQKGSLDTGCGCLRDISDNRGKGEEIAAIIIIGAMRPRTISR